MSVREIAVSAITVTPDRQRRHFDEKQLKELADDIAARGLLQPIVVAMSTKAEGFKLIAGERRLRAHLMNKASTVLAHVMNFDDELSEAEAEYAENTVRADLTWQERTEATARLHELRVARTPKHTVRDTAREILGKPDPSGRPLNNISRATVLHQAGALQDEAIAKAKNENEAWKIFAKKKEQEFIEQLGLTTKVMAKASGHTLLNTTFQEGLKGSEHDGRYSIVVADPPYGIGVEDFGDAAVNAHEYSEDDFEQLHLDLFTLLPRVCKADAHLYLFCDVAHFERWKLLLSADAWRVRHSSLIWPKGSMGHMTEGRFAGFRRNYEMILHASRGNLPYSGVYSDVLKGYPAELDRSHAAQKPVELYQQLLAVSGLPGHHVLDPCGGSGPIIPAATKMHMLATVCEPNENHFKLCEGRLL